MEKNIEKPKKSEQPYWIRNIIALTITLISIAATLIVAFRVLFCNVPSNDPGLDFIGKSLLPLWATWIGTVLAFYFSKENFEAASKSYQNIIKSLTPEEKMASIPAINAMLPYEKITHLTYPADIKKTLTNILADPDFKDYSRYAIFDEKKLFYRMIHRSTIYRYRSDLVDLGKKPEEINKVTLEEMLTKCSPEISSMLDRGYNFVPRKATLLDVKTAMDAMKECQDVFITENGKKDEPVLGLITNVRLMDNATV